MAATLAWTLALLTAILHNSALLLTGFDPVATPVSALSQSAYGNVQSLGIVLFALAHVALAAALPGVGRGRLWLLGRLTLLISAIATLYVAYYFTSASPAVLAGQYANAPLTIQASLTGLAMALLWPGLKRLNIALWGFNAAWFMIWLMLVPVGMLANDSWLGGYERVVGLVYVLWIIVMGIGLALIGRPDPPRAPPRRAAHD